MALSAAYLLSLGSNQGLRGNSVLASSGAPTSALAALDGDIAVDPVGLALYAARSNGVWPASGVSLRGATGATGASATATIALPATRPLYHDCVGLVANTTLSSTKLNLPYLGASNVIPYFQPTWTSQLAYVQLIVYSGSSNASGVTFYLINANTGSAVYTSSSYSYGTINAETPNVTLPSGGKYFWQVTGTGTTYVAVIPTYTVPATHAAGPVVSPLPPCGFFTAQTLSTTAKPVFWANSTIQTAYFRPYQASALYDATFTNPSGASATFQLYNNTAAAAVGPSYTVSSGGEVRTGALSPSAIPMSAGSQYFWRVTGSGSQAVAINWAVQS